MYKQSKYNYIIPHKERVVYFNGISNKSFSTNIEEHNKLQILFEDPISFEINYPSVLKKFTEWGFFVMDDIDEIDILRYRHKMEVINNRDYHLVINPTLECNFACWYCYQEHPKGYMSTDTIRKVMSHIQYMIEEEHITKLDLSWFGGEPLLFFEEVIYPISSHAKLLCEKFHIPYYASITTNASKIDLNMIRKMKRIELNSFQITIDGDAKRHNLIRNENGKPSFDIIMRNIKDICNLIEEAHITLRFNYDDKTLNSDKIKELFDNIPLEHRRKIHPNFQRVWQTFKEQKPNHETPMENKRRLELTNYCKSLGYFIPSPANAFSIGSTYKCYADRKYHAEINYDGKVYSCTARGYSEEYEIGKLLDNGKIVFSEEKQIQKLARTTFENEMCLPCKFLPLCLGPCSQKIIETPASRLKNLCYLNLTEVSPESVILDYYEKKMSVAEPSQVK